MLAGGVDAALAQTAPAGDSAETGSGNEIVVTAQKRAERLQDVPMAITALTPDSLKAQNATSLRDFYAQVPGLSAQPVENGQVNLAIRGIATGVATNPTVGVTIDDAPVGASTVAALGSVLIPDLDPADLQRIEVLKGPQGTLYGASSMGGLLKYVTTNASTTKLYGLVGGSFSAVDHGNEGGGIRGMVNLPVADGVLGIRASGFWRRDPGYIDNVVSGKKDVNTGESFGGRLAANWSIAPDVSLKVAALYQHSAYDGSSQILVDYLTQPKLGDLTQNIIPGTGTSKSSVQLYTAVFDAKLNSLLTLTSISAYSRLYYSLFRDYSGFGGGAAFAAYGVTGAGFDPYQYVTKKFSQEVRLATDDNKPVSGLIGAFYTKETSSSFLRLNAYNPTTGAKAGFIRDISDEPRFKEYAVFGSMLVKLSSHFDIQGGLRYSKNDQSNTTTTVSSAPTSVVLTSTDGSATTWSVSPRFTVNRNLMFYGRVATGYRAGGPNASLPAGLPASYGPDKTTNYEIGTKGSFGNGMVTYDLSLYHIDWDGIQIAQTAVVGGVTYSYTGNAAKAGVDGAELSLQLKPAQHTRIGFNAAYNDSKLSQTLAIPGAVYAPQGAPLVNTPKYSGSLMLDQEIPLNDQLTLALGATGTYVGQRYGTFARGLPGTGNVRVGFPGYRTLDLRAGLRTERWSANAFVSNVTDTRGVIYASFLTVPATATADYYGNVIRPRTFGLNFEYRFGQ